MTGLTHRQAEILNIARASGRVMVDYLARFESIESAYVDLGLRFGVALPAPSHENKSQHRRYETYYDVKLRSVVARAYQADFELLGYQT